MTIVVEGRMKDDSQETSDVRQLVGLIQDCHFSPHFPFGHRFQTFDDDNGTWIDARRRNLELSCKIRVDGFENIAELSSAEPPGQQKVFRVPQWYSRRGERGSFVKGNAPFVADRTLKLTSGGGIFIHNS